MHNDRHTHRPAGWGRTTTSFIGAVFAPGLLSLSGATLAAPVNQVDPAQLEGKEIITFETVAGAPGVGRNYDTILQFNGASVGERFAGQTVTAVNESDQLSGTPRSPLQLLPGASGQNLTIIFGTSSGNVLGGIGPTGYPNASALGEGAVAILFDEDQSEFGFFSLGGDLGSAVFQFYKRDGTLLHTIIPMELGSDNFAFARDGGFKDIAGIAVYNTDSGGIGFDNIRFDVAPLILSDDFE